MRIALALATTFAGFVVAMTTTAAPAHASSCTPPDVPGYVVTDLHTQGVSCGVAQNLATHVVPRGSVAGFDCTRRHHAHRTATTCQRHGSHDYFIVVFHLA